MLLTITVFNKKEILLKCQILWRQLGNLSLFGTVSATFLFKPNNILWEVLNISKIKSFWNIWRNEGRQMAPFSSLRYFYGSGLSGSNKELVNNSFRVWIFTLSTIKKIWFLSRSSACRCCFHLHINTLCSKIYLCGLLEKNYETRKAYQIWLQ